MFSFFKKKSPLQLLEIKYKKLLEEAFKLSHTDRAGVLQNLQRQMLFLRKWSCLKNSFSSIKNYPIARLFRIRFMITPYRFRPR